MKSENLNFLDPSGPLQACNGTDLPFTVYCIVASYRIYDQTDDGLEKGRNM